MQRSDVVTVFLRHRGDVLLLRRADGAPAFPGRWDGVHGVVENDDPRGTARRVVREAPGLSRIEIVRAGTALTVCDGETEVGWRIHPILADVATRDVEHSQGSAEAEWVPPTEILRRDTVPGLWAVYDRVRPTTEGIAGDREHGSAALSIRALEVLRDTAGLATHHGDDLSPVRTIARALVETRPSMAVLGTRIDRVMNGACTPSEVERAAIRAIDDAFAADEAAASVAAERLAGTVLTISRSGTVCAALLEGAPDVVVAESRPDREGVAVAESLSDAGLDVTLCTDAAVAHVLATRPVDAVLVGADTVLADGGVVNKTGTRAAALAARREDVPVFVVTGSDKITPDREPVVEAGDPSAVYDGDAELAVENPTFDVTPADCVDAILTERGSLSEADVATFAAEAESRRAWRNSGT